MRLLKFLIFFLFFHALNAFSQNEITYSQYFLTLVQIAQKELSAVPETIHFEYYQRLPPSKVISFERKLETYLKNIEPLFEFLSPSLALKLKEELKLFLKSHPYPTKKDWNLFAQNIDVWAKEYLTQFQELSQQIKTTILKEYETFGVLTPDHETQIQTLNTFYQKAKDTHIAPEEVNQIYMIILEQEILSKSPQDTSLFNIQQKAKIFFQTHGYFSDEESAALDALADESILNDLDFHKVNFVWNTIKKHQLAKIEEYYLENPTLSLKDILANDSISKLAPESDFHKIAAILFSEEPTQALIMLTQELAWIQRRGIRNEREAAEAALFSKKFQENKFNLQRLTDRFPQAVDHEKLNQFLKRARIRGEVEFDSYKVNAKKGNQTAYATFKEGTANLVESFLVFGSALYLPPLYSLSEEGGYTKAGESIYRLSRWFENHFQSSVLGTTSELAHRSHAPSVLGNLVWNEVKAVSSLITTPITLLEDGYEYSIKTLYGLENEQFTNMVEIDFWMKSSRCFFYTAEFAAGLYAAIVTGGLSLVGEAATAPIAATVTATTRINLYSRAFWIPAGKSVWKQQLLKTKSPLFFGSGLSLVFAGANELKAIGEEEGAELERFLLNAYKGLAGNMVFMGALSQTGRIMFEKGFTPKQVRNTSLSTDVTESMGDWDETFSLIQKARKKWKTNQSLSYYLWGASVLYFAGNILDAGDSTFALFGGEKLLQRQKTAQHLVKKIEQVHILTITQILGKPLNQKQIEAIPLLFLEGADITAPDSTLRKAFSLEDLKKIKVALE